LPQGPPPGGVDSVVKGRFGPLTRGRAVSGGVAATSPLGATTRWSDPLGEEVVRPP
jgi:hypothetical protein